MVIGCMRLSDVSVISVIGRRRKFGEVSCTECTGHGSDFELIPTIEIETIQYIPQRVILVVNSGDL